MRGFLIVALMLCLGGDAVLWLKWRSSEERVRQAEARVKSAEAKAATPAAQGVFLTDVDIWHLKHDVLTDPVNQLRSDLAGQASLIPFKGTLGGTMGFYGSTHAVLLPGRYVYAPAEDGHDLVHTVLKYDVEPGGKIRWRLLDAVRD